MGMESRGASQVEVLGLFQLLCMAQASLKASASDALCLHLLTACIIDIRHRYDIKSVDFSSVVAWADQSAAPIVRLLFYAAREARCLGDHKAAKLLAICAHGLADAQALNAGRLFDAGHEERGALS
jgi:hypothetical protein